MTTMSATLAPSPFIKAKPLSLKTHPVYNEKWLHAILVDDPGLLGLGDLVVKDVERRQPRAGRLDLLLSDPDTHTRYEVEIQLGPTDESHIIRTIEYWDIEKSRYPQYEHVAVIVAEDITSRFLNVITLFNKAIPLIAIQIKALEVGAHLTLAATTVLDVTALGTDEEDEPGQATDRQYWVEKGSPQSVAIADGILALVNEVTPGMALKYNKHYIGLARGGVPDNFVIGRARKAHLITEFRLPRDDEVTSLIEDAGVDSLDYDKRWGHYKLRLTQQDLANHRELLLKLIRRAAGVPEPASE
jgi:hypothetical protein